MLGFKIFDSDPTELTTSLVRLAHEESLALEVALYGKDPHVTAQFIAFITSLDEYQQNPNKSIHLNYIKYVVNNLKEPSRLEAFHQEIRNAQSLLLRRGVIHYQHASNTHTHLENFEPEQMKQNLRRLHSLAQDYDFTFYIENTFIYQRHYYLNALRHHRLLWDTILDLGLEDRLGLCLDWGHVKAFGDQDSLLDWLSYAQQLKQKGMPIYMHIHDNDAHKDLHASLKESEELGYERFNVPQDPAYLTILSEVLKPFAQDSLILEYSSNIAQEHYDWTKEKLAQLPPNLASKLF